MIGEIALAGALIASMFSFMPPVYPDHDAEPVPVYDYYDGPVLTREAGTIEGPSGKETYYNLDMSGVVAIMRGLGYSENDWPYWVRDDGCKMLGSYIIVAADLSIRPKGTIIETSRGYGIVCDTGHFAEVDPYQLDLAVNW